MFEKELKICESCGEKDLMSQDQSLCNDCFNQEKEKRKKLLEF